MPTAPIPGSREHENQFCDHPVGYEGRGLLESWDYGWYHFRNASRFIGN